MVTTRTSFPVMLGAVVHEICYAEVMDEPRIDVRDDRDVARWAQRLCTSPAKLREAIAAVGPEVERVKGYLFVALVRRTREGLK